MLKTKLFAIIVFIAMVLGCGESAEERRLEEERLIDKVMILKSTEAAQEYLDRYPEGEKAAFCKNMINDEAAFSNASDAGTLESLTQYLNEYPSGRHADEAGEGIRRILFSIGNRDVAITEQKKILKDYLRLSPDGAFAAQAASAIDNIRWLMTCSEDSAVAYINYMGKGGKYDNDASLRIKEKDGRPELQELRLGMTADEVEKLLGPHLYESRLFSNVGGISQYGSFYAMKYPEAGVHCHIRNHAGRKLVYELHLYEPFCSSFNGINIGMPFEKIKEMFPGATTESSLSDKKAYLYKGSQRTLYVGLSRSPGMSTPSRYLRVTTGERELYFPQYSYNASRALPYIDGTLMLTRWNADNVLSGKKLYARMDYGKDSVISIHNTSDSLRGGFVIFGVPNKH
jgi:hypothetical protein